MYIILLLTTVLDKMSAPVLFKRSKKCLFNIGYFVSRAIAIRVFTLFHGITRI